MLGLGGAVLLIPAYLYLPPLFGVTPLDVKSISGMTSVQVLAASLTGMLRHRTQGYVDTRLVLTMGIPITLFAFSGAMFSGSVNADAIVATFGLMATGAAIMMVIGRHEPEETQPLAFNRAGAIGIASGVGFFGGLVGAPGAFILSPLMMTVLKIPTRITIGSTLGIVVLSALATSFGKLLTGQVPATATVVAVVSALPGVFIGSALSHKTRTKTLRRALAVLIGAVGLHMCYRILVR